MEHFKSVVMFLSFVCASNGQFNPWYHAPYQQLPQYQPVHFQPVHQQHSSTPCQHASPFGYSNNYFNNPCPTYFNQPLPNQNPLWVHQINPTISQEPRTTKRPIKAKSAAVKRISSTSIYDRFWTVLVLQIKFCFQSVRNTKNWPTKQFILGDWRWTKVLKNWKSHNVIWQLD